MWPLLIFAFVLVGFFYGTGRLALAVEKSPYAKDLKEAGEGGLLDRVGEVKGFWPVVKQILKIIAFFFGVLMLMYLLIKVWGMGFKVVFVFMSFIGIGSFMLYSGVVLDIKSDVLTRLWIYGSAAVLTVWWVFVPSWLSLDIAGALIMSAILIQCRNISMNKIMIISGAIILYDVFAVFGTHTMIVVGSKAVELQLPALLIIPTGWAMHAPRLFALGLGDVVLPGLTIMFAFRKRALAPKLPVLAVAGYLAGVAVTLIVMFVFRYPQPATLYLIPGVLIPVLTYCWFRKQTVSLFAEPKPIEIILENKAEEA